MKKKKLDNYYKQALVVAELSPDEQTKVGSLLINSNTGAILGSSYNGFIRGAPDHLIPKTRPEKHLYVVHSEVNLICNSARHGMVTEGCFVFCTLSPCISCCRVLFQAGIRKVIFKDKYKDFEKQMDMIDIKLNVSAIEDYYVLDIIPRGEK